MKRISCSQIGFRRKKDPINISFWNVLYPFKVQEWVSRNFKDSKQRVQEEEKLPCDTWYDMKNTQHYKKYMILKTFSCCWYLRIHRTNNINILMSRAFENTHNKRQKHSHASSIWEYTKQTTQTFSCPGHLRIYGTNNINILMPSAFENTQNKQHKHSHVACIGEYIVIACKDAPSLLVTQPHAPCSYTLPTFTA